MARCFPRLPKSADHTMFNIQDDEFEALVTSPERIELLGFKPQKELSTNAILPYAAELDEESANFLEQVKTNLAKAVILREMKPACGIWSSRLMKYIRIYGLKFSKEDHIAFIKLVYELVLIPDLEPCKIHKFATLFVMLTKKRSLLSPEEMTLPWRPLYDAARNIFDKNATQIGMYHYFTAKRSGNEVSVLDMVRKFLSGYGVDDALALFGLGATDDNLPTSLESSFLSLVKCARPYFEVDATKEILAEIMPRVCPWASDTQPLVRLAAFLPVEMATSQAARGHELWFIELVTLWDVAYNAPCGISDLMTIFAGLAKQNPGAVDWEPYVPMMFTKFLHALNLPVGYKDMQYLKNHSLSTKQIASWIVWTIKPEGSVLKQLRGFVAAVESYLHSANQGRWSFKLRDLFRKLAKEFLNRVRRESSKKKSWENVSPAAFALTDAEITEFVSVLVEPTLAAVYGRGGALDVSGALHSLATLRPALVAPPLVQRLHDALGSLTEPHRVTAAMAAVAAIARPLLRGASAGYPEGPTHAVPLLLAVLPGLDPNDIKKTLVTLHFILIFSWMVPIVDCSAARDHYPDLTVEEVLTCDSTAHLEDFVLVFLERIFAIVESSVLENVRLDTKEGEGARSKADAVVESGVSSAATAVLMQCEPRIFREALRKFKAFATETSFETSVAGSMVGVLLRVFARVGPDATLAAFVPDLCEQLLDLLATEEALREENPPRDLIYRLVLLRYVVECDGTVLLKYIDKITPVLDRALKHHANYAMTKACEILNYILSSLSSIELKEWRSSPRDYSAAPAQWLPVREWGAGCLLRDADLQWHVPSEAEARCAQALLDRYLRPEVARLRQWLAGERPIGRERRLRSLRLVGAALACHGFLPAAPAGGEAAVASLVPPTRIPLASGVRPRVTLDGGDARAALAALLADVQRRLLAERSDDTRGLEALVAAWERVAAARAGGGRGGPVLEARLRAFAALERTLDGHGGAGASAAGPARLRMLLADAARLQDEARGDLACEAAAPAPAQAAMRALLELATHPYATVRVAAQQRLYWVLNGNPYSYRAVTPRLAELLAAGGEGDEWHARHKGALYVAVGPRSGPLAAKHDWESARELWPAVLRAPLSEKPSLVRLEQAFADCLHRHFPAVNTGLATPARAVAAARGLLPAGAGPVAGEADAEAREAAAAARGAAVYRELTEELAAVAEAPGVPWRRLEMAMQMLTFCPSLQTAYPPRVVRLVLRALLHDSVTVRRIAQRLALYVVKQRKRPLKKIAVDPYEVAGAPRPERRVPGFRPDIEWAMWADGEDAPTPAEWDAPWLRQPAVGFYAWPAALEVAAPAAEQTFSFDVDPGDMEEGERYIHEFFTDEANVDKLVGFLSVEEKKGKDKFSATRFSLLRMVFAQFGEPAADALLRHALRCAGDAQEAPQRFAAEVAAAALRAPRYWPRERALPMQRRALAVLRAGLAAVTPETLDDWGTAVATGLEKMDPRRGRLVVNALIEVCVPAAGEAGAGGAPDGGSSFGVGARLYALQGALGALSWRAAPLMGALLERLDRASFLCHPYQNVREVASSLLMTVFDYDLVFPGGRLGPPMIEDFLVLARSRLRPLYNEAGDIVVMSIAPHATGSSCAAAECLDALGPLGAAEGASGAAAEAVGALAAAAAPRAGGGGGSPERERPEPGADADAESTPPRGHRAPPERLAAQLESALTLTAAAGCGAAGAAPPSDLDEHARALQLLTTVLRGLMGVVVRSVGGHTASPYPLLPTVCALATRGPPQPHEELPRVADGLLAGLARQVHSPEDFTLAMRAAEVVAGKPSWWARLAGLEFAQALLFYGLPLLNAAPARAAAAERLALRLMQDPRLEVRRAAARLLTGLMHCRALPDEMATLRLLFRCCRSPEPLRRHCGVLGLCAYLASRPYTLGPALGPVLAELSRHTGAPDPVPATIRAALADFRRTHQDDWPRHREQMTAEELDLLADLTAPPSYCA